MPHLSRNLGFDAPPWPPTLPPSADWHADRVAIAGLFPAGGKGNARYIAGIHAAVGRDYTPLAEMFLRVIARTWKRAASSSR
jgi:hypothetical protein